MRHTKYMRGLALLMLACLPVSAVATDDNRLIDRVVETLEARYVDRDRGIEIGTALEAAWQRGEIDRDATPDELATAISEILKTHDRHLDLAWLGDAPPDPAPASGVAVPIEQLRRENFGFRRVEIWPGNVGYLDLRAFVDPPLAYDTATAAMRFLAGSDAVIVDLRQNGGGSPGMVQLLCSYFLGGDGPLLLNSLYFREDDSTRQFWTLPAVPGRPLFDVPLFVLTSARTGSAAEEFAYNLKTRERATLVGETTAGAANPGDVFELGDGWILFVATGKAINPVTGDNWEGRGVSPQVETPAAGADLLAWKLALDALDESAVTSAQQRGIDWARESLAVANGERHALPASMLADYAGEYGSRRVDLADGTLVYRNGRRPPRELHPVAADRFVAVGVDDRRILFERDADGRIARLIEEFTDGQRAAHPRR